MDPLSISAATTTLLALVDWKKVMKGLASDAAGKGAKRLLSKLKPDESGKAAKQALTFFVQEFLAELEDKTPLSSAVPGYHDQLKHLIENAAPEITEWFQPETKDVDLGPVQRMWSGLGYDPLPEDFDWTLVAKNYARDIRKYVKDDSALRERLNTALQEQRTELLTRIAGPDPGFDLSGYRTFLRGECGQMQLSVMHKTAYNRQIELWSVFVPQSARASAPVAEIPREIVRQLRQEGHLTKTSENTADEEITRLRDSYQSSPIRPVLEILERERLVVVLGDPGSGKTSLVKNCIHEWLAEPVSDTLPLWVELKKYAQAPLHGNMPLQTYLGSASSGYALDANRVQQHLQSGRALIYIDGLDEIFDPALRSSVVGQIAGIAARYSTAKIVVTSRIIGYEPENLRNAGFAHATLEDFDDPQVLEFLHKWHAVAEDDAKERTRLQTQIERALKDSRAIRALAGNPLLLTMMAILNRNQELPRDRVELYKEASRVLLHDWDAHRAVGVDNFGRHEKETLLRELAGAMQQAPSGLAGNLIERNALLQTCRKFLTGLDFTDPHGKAQLLVQQLTERNFILCPAGADRFSFVHRTFLEYFCADWFYERLRESLDFEPLKTVFRERWKDEKWHEVLRLIAGMVTEKQAEELILLLMEQDGRHEKLANLMLAAGCLSEVRNRKVVEKTNDVLRRRFVEQAIRYGPPYYYELYEEFSEAGPTRVKAIGLIAFVWRGPKTRTWLRSTAERDYDWIVRRAAV